MDIINTPCIKRPAINQEFIQSFTQRKLDIKERSLRPSIEEAIAEAVQDEKYSKDIVMSPSEFADFLVEISEKALKNEKIDIEKVVKAHKIISVIENVLLPFLAIPEGENGNKGIEKAKQLYKDSINNLLK